MNCYLGVDFGTSGARAIAIDESAQPCAQASLPFTSPAPDQWAQHWHTTLFTLIQTIPPSIRQSLRAIAINGTSSTVLLCDRAGQPLTAPLLYNDASGQSALTTLQQLLNCQTIRPTVGLGSILSATSSLVKLLWWQHHPAYADARFFLHQADWLAFLLHGQLGLSDYHNALKLGYDVVNLRYPDWLESLPIQPLLPQVVPPGTAIAPVQPAIAQELGLPPDCIVRAGTTDSIAAFIASGATHPGEAVTSLGSTLVLKLLSQSPVESFASGIYSHRFGDRWLVGGASNTGGAVLQHFFSETELQDLSAQMTPEQASPLHYYPLLKPGERFPVNDPTLLPQLSPRPADPVAFLHGLLESMARIETQGYQYLQDLGAPSLTHVYTAGGGAKNTAWTVIRQRLLGVPVHPSQHPDAAYGTALLSLKATL